MNKLIERLDTILDRCVYLEKMMQLPAVISDFKRYSLFAKELANLSKIAEQYRIYKNAQQTIEDAQALIKDGDEEIAAMAHQEIAEAEKLSAKILKDIEIMLIPKDPNDDKNVIVEIRGAAGGDEGNIFAGDLFRMYMRYAERVNWKTEILDANESDMGGYSFISFSVKGKGVYSQLKYESGAHRVQRVPKTEASGRIHTSTATVLVMPEAEDIDVQIDEKDIKIDTFRASGAGGQHINKTDSAVRITHFPTGIVVTCQDGRSQIENRAQAMLILKTKIYDEMTRRAEEERGAERRTKIGTGDRSEKIRTYNYPQNRVTDHRINYTVNQLDRIIDGDLGNLIEALINEDQRLKLSGMSL
jgi:peptide chain release factor 1